MSQTGNTVPGPSHSNINTNASQLADVFGVFFFSQLYLAAANFYLCLHCLTMKHVIPSKKIISGVSTIWNPKVVKEKHFITGLVQF